MKAAAEQKIRMGKRGGVRLIRLDSPAQLPAVARLDAKYWRVLSCPASGHEMSDAATLAMDADGDGRIRVRDVQQTIDWIGDVLIDWERLAGAGLTIEVAAVRQDSAEGRALAASLRYLLQLCGKQQDAAIGLADIAEARALLARSPLNGEGIIDSSAVTDPELRSLVEVVLQTVGGKPTKRGTHGVDKAAVDAFYTACKAFAQWHARGRQDAADGLFFLGEWTERATEALIAVEAKIDEWFRLCRIQAFAPDLVKATMQAEALTDRPLAPLSDTAVLPLQVGLNPAWEERLGSFVRICLERMDDVSADSLTAAQWQAVRGQFAAYREWRDGRVGSSVSGLGIEKVTTWLERPKLREQMEELIDRDCALRDDIAGVDAVERLLLLQQHFWEFVHNFINFDRFYALQDEAIFQIGVLYVDGRSLHLCVALEDVARHAATASRSGLFLIYCRCTRAGQTAGLHIAAAVTAGSADGLFVGKHGVFYDREGAEWDAEIVRMVESPINLWQAITAPFRRINDILVGHVESLSSSREKALQSSVASGVKQVESNLAAVPEAAAGTVAAPRRESAMGLGGFMAGGGFAVAAVTSSLAFLSSTLAKIHPIYVVSAIVSVVLLIVLPTALVSWLRLRSRDIGKVLEANSWAINGRIPLTRSLGKELTALQRRRG